MSSPAHFLAHCVAALLLPAVAGRPLPLRVPFPAESPVRAAPEPPVASGLQADDTLAPLRVLEQARKVPAQGQVRIESRVIIRVSPSSRVQEDRVMAALPRRSIPTTYEEADYGRCVDVEDIAAARTTENDRLLLFLRDRQVLSASFRRSCNVRAFYSGFYVERADDGRLCVSRDELRSRMGTSCQIDDLSRLVAMRE